MSSSTTITFSPNESETLGLKIGRCNTDSFDENALQQGIFSESYDVCRLKIPAEDEWAAYKLNSMGLPYSFSGSIRRYNTPITEEASGNYINKNLTFERYDGSQDQIFKELLIDTWGTYPIGYYRTPIVNEYVNKEIEIESVFTFYKKYNLDLNHKHNSMMFIKDKGHYVAFFALNIIGNTLESHIGGIKSEFRKNGYFLDKLRYIKLFCLENKLTHFAFGARNENALVQRLFQAAKFNPIGTENVFHITSFLSYDKGELLNQSMRFSETNNWSIQKKIVDAVQSILSSKSYGNYESNFHFLAAISENENYNICLQQLTNKSTSEHYVVKLYNSMKKLNVVAYFKLK